MTEAGAQRVVSLVGQVVRVEVSGSQPVEGELHSYDPPSRTLALSVTTDPTSAMKHWTIVREEHVTSIEPVPGARPADPEADDLPQVSEELIRKREKRTLERAAEDVRHINEEVTNSTQNIYNALRKTMPCTWNGNDIEVMGLVTIRGPKYTPESCEGSDESALTRVRKVVRALARVLAHAPCLCVRTLAPTCTTPPPALALCVHHAWVARSQLEGERQRLIAAGDILE